MLMWTKMPLNAIGTCRNGDSAAAWWPLAAICGVGLVIASWVHYSRHATLAAKVVSRLDTIQAAIVSLEERVCATTAHPPVAQIQMLLQGVDARVQTSTSHTTTDFATTAHHSSRASATTARTIATAPAGSGSTASTASTVSEEDAEDADDDSGTESDMPTTPTHYASDASDATTRAAVASLAASLQSNHFDGDMETAEAEVETTEMETEAETETETQRLTGRRPPEISQSAAAAAATAPSPSSSSWWG